jgi:hypothetical protein
LVIGDGIDVVDVGRFLHHIVGKNQGQWVPYGVHSWSVSLSLMEFGNIKSMVALCVTLVHRVKNSDGRSEVSVLVIIITIYIFFLMEKRKKGKSCYVQDFG